MIEFVGARGEGINRNEENSSDGQVIKEIFK